MKALREHFIFDAKGKRKGVFLSIKKYRELLEDLHDLAVVAERRKEKTITLKTMKQRLKKIGVI